MTDEVTSKPGTHGQLSLRLWVRMIRAQRYGGRNSPTQDAGRRYGLNGYVQTVAQLVDGNLFDGVELAEGVVADQVSRWRPTWCGRLPTPFLT